MNFITLYLLSSLKDTILIFEVIILLVCKNEEEAVLPMGILCH